jgi:hypothetical protein
MRQTRISPRGPVLTPHRRAKRVPMATGARPSNESPLAGLFTTCAEEDSNPRRLSRTRPQPGGSGVRCVQIVQERPDRPGAWTIWTHQTIWMLPRVLSRRLCLPNSRRSDGCVVVGSQAPPAHEPRRLLLASRSRSFHSGSCSSSRAGAGRRGSWQALATDELQASQALGASLSHRPADASVTRRSDGTLATRPTQASRRTCGRRPLRVEGGRGGHQVKHQSIHT